MPYLRNLPMIVLSSLVVTGLLTACDTGSSRTALPSDAFLPTLGTTVAHSNDVTKGAWNTKSLPSNWAQLPQVPTAQAGNR